MKINKENNKTQDSKPDEKTKVHVLAHILIKDKDTGQILVDKRG